MPTVNVTYYKLFICSQVWQLGSKEANFTLEGHDKV